MIQFLHLGSFVFGLLAWILPVVNLVGYGKKVNKNWVMISLISTSACAVSLCFEVFAVNYRVTVKDWSALLDTMRAVSFTSAVLLIGTITLNAITLTKYSDKTIKQESK